MAKITAPATTIETFSQLFDNDQILIGCQMAHDNEYAVGDEIELLFSSNESVRGHKLTFNSHTTIIGGIFKTGIDEFDSNVIYCPFSLLETLFPDIEVEQVTIQLHPHADEAQTIAKLKKRLGIDVYSWKDLYPSLFAALALEKICYLLYSCPHYTGGKYEYHFFIVYANYTKTT